MNKTINLSDQASFPGELVETRDLVIDLADGSWEVRLNPPPGRGWRVFDAHRSFHTTWVRVIDLATRKASRAGTNSGAV